MKRVGVGVDGVYGRACGGGVLGELFVLRLVGEPLAGANVAPVVSCMWWGVGEKYKIRVIRCHPVGYTPLRAGVGVITRVCCMRYMCTGGHTT